MTEIMTLEQYRLRRRTLGKITAKLTADEVKYLRSLLDERVNTWEAQNADGGAELDFIKAIKEQL